MRAINFLSDIPNINPEEITEFQENRKSEIYTKLDSNWKMTIKEQIESELNRRVREALDTPPLERIKKHQQEAILKKSHQERSKNNLNSHINFDGKEKSKFIKKPSISTNYIKTTEYKIDNDCQNSEENDHTLNGYNKFEYWLKPHYETQQITSSGVMFKLSENGITTDQEVKPFKTGFEALQNFGTLTQREKEIYFSTFTKDGFKESMRTGKLPDGSKLEALANGVYRDKYGIMRDKDGPFWPKDIGPLYPAPHHKRIYSEEEPFCDPLKEKDEMSSKITNHGQYTAIWRHMQIVYDSESSIRNQRPSQHADNVCPYLIFESRFESGNLRQARRIGQFDYELVLNNDLYTKRHTQWFYFRIQNMEKNVTYKFIIINLLKPSSLYMQGMRMLMYSEKNVNKNHIGWYRTGHHIRYSRNFTHLQCPLLNREMAYFQLEFQLEFDHENDSCYLSHCYPYTYTDLKNDLNNYQIDSQTTALIHKEVLCETRIGNSCFIITITDKNVPDKEKRGAVITARVHPGETNSSWMMNGLIQFLISDCLTAKNLRKRILFKIIPMLNPDGVIIGNYRCSTAGRDLNRNYRCPREESFPTIYHAKKLVESLKEICSDVALYCDLHGHSRKHNVFMYGCDSQYLNVEDVNDINPILNLNTVQSFIKDRIFPFLMQKNGPDIFSFSGCHFKIRKCKESTGRVVMWKQFNVADSYTLEATFSGTDLNNPRHFNVLDLENIGKIFCESLSIYIDIMNDEKREKEIGLELLKVILNELVKKNRKINNLFRKLAFEKSNKKENQEIDIKSCGSNHQESAILISESEESHMNLELFINNLKMNDFNHMKDLNFEISDIEENSSSSDSDSESQPEETVEIEQKFLTKIKKKKKKIKIQMKEQKEISSKKPLLKKLSSKNFPMINKVENPLSSTETKFNEKTINTKPFSKMPSLRQLPLFLSKYEGRSNGGIPCFSEERVLERARRKSLITIKKDLEESFYRMPFEYSPECVKADLHFENRYLSFSQSSEDIAEQYFRLQKQSNNILHYKSIVDTDLDEAEPNNIDKQTIQKPMININQINEISKPFMKRHVILKTGEREIFKSVTSEDPLETVKEKFVSKKYT